MVTTRIIDNLLLTTLTISRCGKVWKTVEITHHHTTTVYIPWCGGSVERCDFKVWKISIVTADLAIGQLVGGVCINTDGTFFRLRCKINRSDRTNRVLSSARFLYERERSDAYSWKVEGRASRSWSSNVAESTFKLPHVRRIRLLVSNFISYCKKLGLHHQEEFL